MSISDYAVLVAEPDARLRAKLVHELTPLGCTVLQADNGVSALRILGEQQVRVVMSELYLKTEEEDCLIKAIRKTKSLRHTRALAHTRFSSARDRDWAMTVGADAYLIHPTRGERLRYVVSRLASERGARAAAPSTPAGAAAAAGTPVKSAKPPKSPYKN